MSEFVDALCDPDISFLRYALLAGLLASIALGVIGGSVMHLEITPWVTFLAGFGAVVLTFLAGAEINPDSLKNNLAESLGIGFLSFLLPFLGGMAAAYYWLGWDVNASKIAGIALSTTSVAVSPRTTSPRAPAGSTNPLVSRRPNASRTGVRLTRSRSATSSSRRRSPGR